MPEGRSREEKHPKCIPCHPVPFTDPHTFLLLRALKEEREAMKARDFMYPWHSQCCERSSLRPGQLLPVRVNEMDLDGTSMYQGSLTYAQRQMITTALNLQNYCKWNSYFSPVFLCFAANIEGHTIHVDFLIYGKYFYPFT